MAQHPEDGHVKVAKIPVEDLPKHGLGRFAVEEQDRVQEEPARKHPLPSNR